MGHFWALKALRQFQHKRLDAENAQKTCGGLRAAHGRGGRAYTSHAGEGVPRYARSGPDEGVRCCTNKKLDFSLRRSRRH